MAITQHRGAPSDQTSAHDSGGDSDVHRNGARPGDRRSVDERREELLDAAVAILADEGLARTTTRAVTERAGLALGAFHYAFRSKDELLETVIDRITSHQIVVLESAARGQRDLTATSLALLEAFWTSFEQSPLQHLALYELTVNALREPTLRAAATRADARTRESIGEVLASAPDAPDEARRRDLAGYLSATLQGLVLRAILEDDPAAARRRLAMHAQLLESLTDTFSDGAS